MKLIVGLGNPGAKYAANRHNIGFMALDRVAEDHGLGPWKSRFQGLAAEGRLGETRVTLLKPQTFMNLSGQAVGEAMRYLAELPWVPDAILENGALIWNQIEAQRVRVSLGEVAVEFRFDGAGDIVEMTAKDRPVRDPDGESRLRDWRGRFSEYRWIGGRRIPARGEVGYDYPDGYEPYWRGEINACHLRH